MRVIIAQAGGCEGFQIQAKANSSSGNYHKMNHDNYKNRLAKQLLPNLPEKTVIVMDNASYHVLSEKSPNTNSKKSYLNDCMKP